MDGYRAHFFFGAEVAQLGRVGDARLDEDDACVADAASYDARMAISAKPAQLECVGQSKS